MQGRVGKGIGGELVAEETSQPPCMGTVAARPSGLAELLVRTTLSCLFETKGDEDRDYLTGFEDRNSRQWNQATTTVKRKLAIGTLHAIYRQACRYVPAADLRPSFFAD